jgi:hypothetical protein
MLQPSKIMATTGHSTVAATYDGSGAAARVRQLCHRRSPHQQSRQMLPLLMHRRKFFIQWRRKFTLRGSGSSTRGGGLRCDTHHPCQDPHGGSRGEEGVPCRHFPHGGSHCEDFAGAATFLAKSHDGDGDEEDLFCDEEALVNHLHR